MTIFETRSGAEAAALPSGAREAARDFEAILMQILLRSAKSAARPAPFRGEEMFSGLLDAALVRAASLGVRE